MKVVAWNVGPRFWRKIIRSLGGIKPMRTAKITALFEASNPLLVAGLRARYPHRRVICHRSDVVAILRRGVRRPRVEVISHDVPWTGPHLGRPKRGRRWLLLVWDDEAILLIHRVTRPGNEKAWDAETKLIARVVARVDLPDKLAVIGDHNREAKQLEDEYADMGLRLLPVNAKVDQAAVRDMDGEGVRLGNHDSDHVALLWDVA
ncbi:MAG: hypothetical protein ABIR39_16565 [Nocardioides sp.]|uniref:hypothetical protein n=1 Tax=Nocardioides sp. TaxID=35761 RepID=UPI00326727DA